jgi:class 3 adenylate cyclase
MARKHSPDKLLVDLSQDIAGRIPIDLVRSWVDGQRSGLRAEAILHPYLVRGTALSADSAGLTARSRSLDLVQVIAQLSRGKQVLHAVARAAGGRAPGGRWVADNAQLFFPDTVPVADAVSAALEMHRHVAGLAAGVTFGLCLHHECFYDIGGGLYGMQANIVEFLAEECAAGGETLVTRPTLDALGADRRWKTVRREDLTGVGTEVHAVRAGPPFSAPVDLSGASIRYPIPFSEPFYGLLCQMTDESVEAAERASILASIQERYLMPRTIVIAQCPQGPANTAFEIMQGLVCSAHVSRLVYRLMPESALVVENTGDLVLVAFTQAQDALDFAVSLAEKLSEIGLAIQVGIDSGPVLLIQDPGEKIGILGAPVNQASKQAHELGEPGMILITEDAARGLRLPSEPVRRYREKVSGVVLEGLVIAGSGAGARPAER